MSYGSDSDFQAWLTAQGLTLPVGANLTALRTIGSAYVDGAYEHRLSCSRRAGGYAQDLAWPRTGHFLNGEELPPDFIPPSWVNAAYRAAYLEGTNPGWATGSVNPNRVTKREKVDTIEREFFAASDTAQADVAAGMNADGVINGMVAIWLCPTTRNPNSLFRVI